MAQLGMTKSLYMQVSGTEYVILKGETSSSINISADMLEVSDKTLAFKQYIAGLRGGTAEATFYADDADTTQKAALTALLNGTKVKCFQGELGSGSTPEKGFMYEALVSNISEPYEVNSAIARSMSLQITGEITVI